MRKLCVLAMSVAVIACGASLADAKTSNTSGGPGEPSRDQSHPAVTSGQAYDPAGVNPANCAAVRKNPAHYPSSTWAFCANQPYPQA